MLWRIAIFHSVIHMTHQSSRLSINPRLIFNKTRKNQEVDTWVTKKEGQRSLLVFKPNALYFVRGYGVHSGRLERSSRNTSVWTYTSHMAPSFRGLKSSSLESSISIHWKSKFCSHRSDVCQAIMDSWQNRSKWVRLPWLWRLSSALKSNLNLPEHQISGLACWQSRKGESLLNCSEDSLHFTDQLLGKRVFTGSSSGSEVSWGARMAIKKTLPL